MWVAELECPHGHGFEGWFGSRDEFDAQTARALVHCPTCGSAQVQCRLSAPRLNLGTSTAQAAATAPAALAGPEQLLRELVAAVRSRSEDLGAGFAAEARRIHQGQAPERAIRGQASAQEFEALRDAGIAVYPLPSFEDETAH